MSYNKAKIFKQAKEVTVKNKLFFIEDIITFLPISKQTFYTFFPLDSDEFDAIKDLLDINKTNLKISMRNKWYKSANPSLQIALMKIICNEDEAHRLNGSSIKADVTSGGKEIQNVPGISTITVNIVNPLNYDDDDDDNSE